jgi:hypothetical protein
MVAAEQGAGLPAAHRTWLRPNGRGKAGLEGGDKLALGGTTGGAVRLVDGPGPLVVAEGIETALAAWCLRGDPTAGTWAALSTLYPSTCGLARIARLASGPMS